MANTITAESGYKTRPFDRILHEVKTFLPRFTPRKGTPWRRGASRDDPAKGRHRMYRRWRGAISDSGSQTTAITRCAIRGSIAEQAIELAFLLARIASRPSAPVKAKPFAGGGPDFRCMIPKKACPGLDPGWGTGFSEKGPVPGLDPGSCTKQEGLQRESDATNIRSRTCSGIKSNCGRLPSRRYRNWRVAAEQCMRITT